MATSVKPCVLIMGVSKWSKEMFEEMYGVLLVQLKLGYNLISADNADSALQQLKNSTPAAVLIVDAGFHDPAYQPFRKQLPEYVKVAGGTVIFCGLFSSRSDMPSISNTFQELFSLPWVPGSYHRSTFVVSKTSPLSVDRLSPSYSMKAQHLSNLAPGDAVYIATKSSTVESFVFAPTPVDSSGREAPVAFRRVGKGYVGYVGDVNGEDGSTAVVMAMCQQARMDKT